MLASSLGDSPSLAPERWVKVFGACPHACLSRSLPTEPSPSRRVGRFPGVLWHFFLFLTLQCSLRSSSHRHQLLVTLLGSQGCIAKGFHGVVWSESRGFICWKMGDFDSVLPVGWSESLTFLEGCVFCHVHTQEAVWFLCNNDDYYE